MSKKNLAGLVLLLFVLQSCGLSNPEIERYNWKLTDMKIYDTSKPLEQNIDVISFKANNYYALRNDTIFRQHQPYAVIIDRQKLPSASIEIVVIDSQDIRRYVGK